MTLGKHKAHLDALLSREGLAPARGAPPQEIHELEAALGAPLPRELAEWLSLCRGTQIGLYPLLGTDERHGAVGIRTARASEWCTPEVFPVAGDGCGNYYCLVPDPGVGTGYAVGFVDVISGDDPYAVASSLDRFLHFYLDRIERDYAADSGDEADYDPVGFFNAEPTTWPFSREIVVAADPDIERVRTMVLPWNT